MAKKEPDHLEEDGVVSIAAYESIVLVDRAGEPETGTEYEYRGYIDTASLAVAGSPQITAIADVEVLKGEGLKYRLRPKEEQTVRDVEDAIIGVTGTSPRKSMDFDVPELDEAFMLDTGYRFYVGLSDTSLIVATVHLFVGRTAQDVARDDHYSAQNVLVCAAVRCGDAEHILLGSELEIAERLFEVLLALNPHIVVGFNLATFHLKHVNAILERAGKKPIDLTIRGRRVTRNDRSIIDLEALCGHYGTDRSPSPLNLTALAHIEGMSCSVPTSPRDILVLRESPDRARQVAREALDAASSLVSQTLPGALQLTRELPVSLATVAHRSPSALVEKAMRARYHADGHALPIQTAGDKKPGGGWSQTLKRGRHVNVVVLDLTSAYAAIINALKLAPRSDYLHAFPAMVKVWLDARSAAGAAEAAATQRGDPASASQYRALKKRYKALLFNCYGTTGSEWNRFADPALRGHIASACKEVTGAMIAACEALGCEMLTVETDGLYVALPATLPITAEELRTSAEQAANEVLGVSELEVRSTGPHDAALITQSLRILSNGESKGWRGPAPSPFAARVRDEVVRSLLAGDGREIASSRVLAACDLLQQQDVDVADLAVPFIVSRPPAEATERSDYTHAGWKAALEAGAVDGEVIDMVMGQNAGGIASWQVIAGDHRPAGYDITWALTSLRSALAPLDYCFDVAQLWAGKPLKGPVPREVNQSASGVASTRLLAGLKTAGTVTARLHAQYGDQQAEEAFVAQHGDAHALLLGFFGAQDDKAALGRRVRTGDFYVEFEHHTDDELPLDAANTCIAVLMQHGADPYRDIRVLYNGHRSILVRVRQGALGVENCVELHDIYGHFAASLGDAIGNELGKQSRNFYDEALYRADATYRLWGVRHEQTGFCATWLPVSTLQSAVSLSELRRTLPQSVSFSPFSDAPTAAGLRQWCDEASAGCPRTTRHDPASRTIRPESISRRQRGQAHRKVRLKLLPDEPLPPCAQNLLRRAELGESIGFVLAAKGIFELRLLGWGRRRIAQLLASGAGGPTRYKGRVVSRSDGPDLADALWPDDVDSSYHRGCRSPAVKAACDFGACYRSKEPQAFDDSMSPTFEEARQSAFAATKKVRVPEENEMTACGLPPRSGKSRRAARLAVRHATRGERVLIAAPNHEALRQQALYVKEELAALPGSARVLTVQLLGRTHCLPSERKRRSCSGCPHDIYIEGANRRQLNPELKAISAPPGSVIDQARCNQLAHGACPRSVSRYLAPSADIVLAVHSHLTNDRWPAIAGSRNIDIVFVDEADALLENVATSADSLTIAQSRQALDSTLATPCDMGCAHCYLDFNGHPSAEARNGGVVQTLQERHSPEVLFDTLDAAMRALAADPSRAPHINLKTLRSNLAQLSALLPAHDSLRRGHHVSPRDYNAAIPTHAASRHRAGAVVMDAGDDAPAVFVPLRRCVSSDAPLMFDKRRWRRRLLEARKDEVEAASLAGLAVMADFLDHAARIGEGALLTPSTRPGSWASWQNSCTVELRAFDKRTFQRLASFLSQRRTVLLSGTLPDHGILRAMFPNVRTEDQTVPLHRDLSIFVHTVQHTGRAEPFLPRRYEAEDLLSLIACIHSLLRRSAPWRKKRFNVRVYARSKGEQEHLLKLARQDPIAGFTIVDVNNQPPAPSTLGPRLEVDYLRSPESRAIDVDVDLLIIYGSGLPNFDGFLGTRQVLADLGAVFPIDVLAEDARHRAVVQALLRTAALPDRRVAMVINDMTVGDLPEWLHHRVRPADSLYREIPETDPSKVSELQRGALAAAVVDSLLPRSSLPDLDEVSAWTADGHRDASDRRRQANLSRLQAMVEVGRGGAELRPSQSKGSKSDWGAMLAWLASRGVLTFQQKGTRLSYFFVQEGLEHCIALLGSC